MASLVFCLVRAVNACFNPPEKPQYNKIRSDNVLYNPHAEILGTLLKVCVAAGVYGTFSWLMAQDRSPVATIATGALLYGAVTRIVGHQTTDLGTAVWFASQAYAGFRGSKLDLRQISIILGNSVLSLAVFSHIFSIWEAAKTSDHYLDKFSTVIPFSWKTHSVWHYILKQSTS